jgi:hypothetical protein
VVYRRSRLALATACGSRGVPHARVICFLIVAAIVVGHSRNPLMMLIAPLLATLLGIMDGDIG